ncbi:MAG: MerR family transcriptional regulator [Ruminococcaceae bacterium]|nr:MerR family transcriptional regulator [Oscillospiraceae bacterium]
MYKLTDIALITGLTERTLRSYLKKGLLKGEKKDGVWFFDEEAVKDFLSAQPVRAAMKANRNALFLDFLHGAGRSKNAACVVLHLPEDNSADVAEFFCRAVNERKGLEMRFDTMRRLNRVILTGDVETVSEILVEYRAEKK